MNRLNEVAGEAKPPGLPALPQAQPGAQPGAQQAAAQTRVVPTAAGEAPVGDLEAKRAEAEKHAADEAKLHETAQNAIRLGHERAAAYRAELDEAEKTVQGWDNPKVRGNANLLVREAKPWDDLTPLEQFTLHEAARRFHTYRQRIAELWPKDFAEMNIGKAARIRRLVRV
jgi:hypothetical protein